MQSRTLLSFITPVPTIAWPSLAKHNLPRKKACNLSFHFWKLSTFKIKGPDLETKPVPPPYLSVCGRSWGSTEGGDSEDVGDWTGRAGEGRTWLPVLAACRQVGEGSLPPSQGWCGWAVGLDAGSLGCGELYQEKSVLVSFCAQPLVSCDVFRELGHILDCQDIAADSCWRKQATHVYNPSVHWEVHSAGTC